MTREIKFRAYNKRTKQIRDIDSVDWEAGHEYFDDDYYIPLQYTGLKDKNGVEIYEGDIIEYYLFPEATPTQWVIEIPRIYRSIKDNELNKIEVIGNIYQNKELLNN